MNELQGVLHFPAPLFVSPNALGRAVEIAIAGAHGRLQLPRLPARSETHVLGFSSSDLRPPEDAFEDLPFHRRMHFAGEPRDPDWGRVYTAGLGHSLVKAALVRFDLGKQADSPSPAGERIRVTAGRWLELFIAAVEALTLQVPGETGGVDHKGREVALYYREDSGRLRAAQSSSGTFVFPLSRFGGPLTDEQFETAVAAANAGNKPRLEHMLLANARRAVVAGEERSSVLDAATAVEITLGHAVRHWAEAARVELPGGNLTLGRLVGITEKLRPQLVDATLSTFVDLRNEVAHDGRRPKPEDVRRAVSFATNLVVRLSPRPYDESHTAHGV